MTEEIKEFLKDYPRFADGRVDYTHARICFVISCTVVFDDEVLLTYRSADVIAYPNTWNGISGFIDEIKPLEDIITNELAEEVNIQSDDINVIKIMPLMIQTDDEINREWRVFPVFVELSRRPTVMTNWENKEAKWIPLGHVENLALLPVYVETFQTVMKNKAKER